MNFRLLNRSTRTETQSNNLCLPMNILNTSRPTSILVGPISNRLKPWRLLPAAVIAAAFPTMHAAKAASVTWDGGTSGTGTEIGTAANWSSDTLPVTNGGTAAFAGTVAGNLSLIYNTATLAGSSSDNGINFYLSSSQTGNVTIDGVNAIRMGNLTIDAGAGAFTFGDGVNSSGNLTLNFGRVNSDHPIWTNNSSNVVTINSDVAFGAGGGAPKVITFDGSGNWQVYANLTTGTGAVSSVAKTGSGAITLSGSCSTGGGFSLYGGVLNLNHAYALGSGTLTLSATGATPISINNTSAGAITLTTNNPQTWGSDFTFVGTKDLNLGTGAVSMTGSRTVTVSAGNLAVGGAITGSGTLSKSGAGALTLSGSSSFSGGVALKAGSLNINHAYALGSGTLTLSGTGATPISIDNTSAGAITLAGNNPQNWAGDFTFTGTKDLNLGTGAVTVTGDRTLTVSAGALTVGGAITSSGTLTKAGAGALVLGGSNNITGNFAINAGMLSISSTTALPGWNTNGKYSVASGATFAVGNALTTADITSILGTTNFLAGAAIGFDTTAGDRTLSTAFGDTTQGALGLTKLGSNTLFLTGINTYTGNTTISSGALSISSTGALPGWITNGRVSVASGATLAVTNALTDANVTSLLGTTNFLAGAAIGYDTTTGDRTVAGVIANTAQGALGVTKLGGNTLTLTGTHTYTGPTTISSGTLQLGNGTTDGVISTSGGITNNGALVFNQLATQSYTNPISGTGTLTKNGAGTLVLNTTNPFSGVATINSGTLQIGNGTLDGSIAGPIVNNANLTFQTVGSKTYAGVVSGTGVLNKSAAGTLTLTGSNTYTGVTTVNAGTLQIGDGTTDGSIAGPIVDNANVIFQTVGSRTYGNLISGTGTLNKTGAGTLTLTGTHTYTGVTTVSSGTLQLGDGTTNGSIPSTAWVADNGVVVFNVSGNQSVPQWFISGGLLVKTGTGTLTLTGNNVQGAGTTISAGVLSISGTASLSNWSTNGKYSVASGATLAVGNGVTDANVTTMLSTTNFQVGSAIGYDTSSGDRTVATAIGDTAQGALGLTKVGLNTLVLTGTNTYTGNTAIKVGSLSISSTSALPGWNVNGRVFVASGAMIVVTNAFAASDVSSMLGTTNFAAGATIGLDTSAGSRTISTVLSGQGVNLTKIGSNVLTLTGSNTYTGTTTISAGGTLSVGDGTTDGSIASSSGIVDGGALAYNLLGSQTFAGNISGGGSLTKSGSGTLILSGSNSYSGNTTINTGILNIRNSYALGPGTLNNTTTNGELQVQGDITLDSSRVYRLSNNASGGSGALVAIRNVSGTNTLQGALTVTGGGGGLAVQSDSGLITLNNIGTDTANRTLIFQGSANGVVNGNITDASGGATVTKNGAGTWTLSGSNSFTGITTINVGILQANHANALSTTNIVFGGGTLQYTGSSAGQDWSARFKNSTAGAIALDTNGQNVTLAGVIDSTNTAGLTKSGSGTLTLSATNTFSGVTTVSSGTLKLNNNVAIQNSAFNPSGAGVLDLSSANTPTFGGLSGSGNYTAPANVTGITLNPVSGSVTYSGNLDGAIGMSLTKTGAGTQILSGSNTYTGTTTINGGTLQANHSSALGAGNITFGGGTLQYTSVTSGLDWAARFKNSPGAVALDTNGQSVTLAGAIDSSNVGGLTKAGAGTLTLSGSNSYTGPTLISTGTLQITDGAFLPSASSITNSGALLFNLAGSGTYGNAISGAGAVTKIGVGALTLTGSNSLGNTNLIGGTTTITSTLSSASSTMTLTGTGAGTVLNLQGATATIGTLNIGNLLDTGESTVNQSSGTTTITNTFNIGYSYMGRTDTYNLSGGTLTSTNSVIQLGIQNSFGVYNQTGGTANAKGVLFINPSRLDTLNLTGGTLNLGASSLALSATNSQYLINLGGGTMASLVAWSSSLNAVMTGSSGRTTFDTTGGDIALSGVLSGTGGLIKAGTGTLTLSGTNTFSGVTTINSGTLKLSNNFGLQNSVYDTASTGILDLTSANTPSFGGLNGSSNYTLPANVTALVLNSASGSVATYSGILGSATPGMTLTKIGAGTQVLSGANNYTGTTTVSAGALVISNTAALPGWNTPAAYSVASGAALGVGNAVLDADVATMVATGNFASGALLAYDTSAGDRTITSVPGGLGLALKMGANTLTLTDPSSYANATAVTGGTLTFANSFGTNTIGAVTVTGGAAGAAVNISGPTTLSGTNLTIGNTNGDRSVAVVSANTTLEKLNIGNVAGSAGALYLTNGTLTHSTGLYAHEDFALNGYGYLNVSGGTLIGAPFWQSGGYNGSTTGLGIITQTNGTVTLNTGEIFVLGGVNGAGGTGVLNMNGGVMTTAWAMGSGWDTSTSGRGEFNITGGSLTAVEFDFHGTTTGVLNLNGGIFSVGTVKSSGTSYNNSNSVGYVNFHGGTLQATSDGATLINLSTTNTRNNLFIYSEGATIDTNGKNVSIVNGFNAPTGNGVSSIGLTGSGAGYIGEPYVQITGGGGSGATARATIDPATGLVTDIVVTNPGTGYTSTPTVTLLGGGSTTPATLGTVTTAANTSGGLTKSGSGTLTLTGTSTYTGVTTINSGTLQIGNGTTDGSISTSSGVIDNGALAFNLIGSLTMPWAISGSGALTKSGGGTLSVTASNSYTGATTVSAGTLQLGDGTSGHDGSLATTGIVNNSLVKLNFYGDQKITYPITGNGTLQKFGAGTATLTGSNSAGVVSIVAGTLQLGDGTSGNDGALSPTSISNNGALAFNQAGNQSIGVVISGTGNVTKAGSGTLTLTASNSYSGATIVNGGTLQLGDGVNGHDGSLSTSGVTNNGTLSYNLYGSQTASYGISGSGNLTKAGVGTLILSSSNGYTGTTSINAGTLQANHASALGAGNITFGGGMLQYTSASVGTDWSARIKNSTGAIALDTGTNNVSFASPIDSTNVGGLTKGGSGTLIFTGSNGLSGLMTINSGFVQLGNGTTDGSISAVGAITTGWGSNVAFNVAGNQTYAGSISGNGTLWKSGSGTLTLTGSSSYIWGTNVDAGIVNLQNSFALGASTTNCANVNAELQLQGNITLDSSRTFSMSNNGTGTAGLVGFRNVSGTNTIQGAISVITGGGGLAVQSDSGMLTLSTINCLNATRALIFRGAGNGAVTGNITDTGGGATLTKSGAGTWTLSGSNSYTGATTISAGTLQIGDGTADGSILSSSAITNNAALIYNVAGSQTAANVISGSGTVSKTGVGALTLSGSNAYSGGTTVSNGTLQVGSANSLGNGGLIVNGGTLDLGGYNVTKSAFGGSGGAITNSVSGTSTLTSTVASGTSGYAGTISNGTGSVVVTKEGAGKLILSGSLSMAGLNANNGMTELAQSGSIGAIAISGSGSVALTAHSGAYKVLETSSLSIAGGGSIDLWNNAMVLRASGTAENATNLTTVKAAVNAASNGLQWNGTGLGSTTAFNEAGLGKTQALAVMVYDNTVIKQSSFEGVSGLGYFDGETPVGFNQVLVKLTYLGDFNADGIVNASDYTWLDGYALGSNNLGDLNGDGLVNATDYTWLDGSALNQSFGVLAAQQNGGGSPVQAPAVSAALAVSPEAVPEPGAVSLLLTGALGLLGFRRKNGARKNS